MITRGERWRRSSIEESREIVAESLGGGVGHGVDVVAGERDVPSASATEMSAVATPGTCAGGCHATYQRIDRDGAARRHLGSGGRARR